MLEGHNFWVFIEHVIPVYAIVLLALGLWKLKVIQPIHAPGIARFLSVLAIPFFAFNLMAFNDPYQANFKLVAADSLQKVIALMIGVLYWKFAKNGKLDHLIKFFMLATLPNIVIVGDTLLEPLYGTTLGDEDVHGKLVTLIFFQVLIWFNLVITMYETRIVLLEWQANADATHVEVDLESQKQHEEGKSESKSVFSIDVTGNGDQGHEKDDQKSADYSLSYTSEELPSGGKGTTEEAEGQDQDIKRGKQDRLEVLDQAAPGKRRRREENMAVLWSILAPKVFKRLTRVPVTCAILIGFAYSLLSYRWKPWQMPYYVQTTVELFSQGAIGMALCVLGMTWGSSRHIMICSWKKITFGMVIRVVGSPLIMVVTSLALGLKGESFRFAVLQAVVPQSVFSFVLAKEYDVDAEEFAAAAILQLLLCVPFIVIYYIVLENV